MEDLKIGWEAKYRRHKKKAMLLYRRGLRLSFGEIVTVLISNGYRYVGEARFFDEAPSDEYVNKPKKSTIRVGKSPLTITDDSKKYYSTIDLISKIFNLDNQAAKAKIKEIQSKSYDDKIVL